MALLLSLTAAPTTMLRIPSSCLGSSSSRSGGSVFLSPLVLPISRGGRSGAAAVVKATADTTRKKYKGTYVRKKRLEEMIEQKVMEAKEACEGDVTSDECKVAWDEVEEVSQAKADLRRRIQESDADPLESFCLENPETDECRIYED